VGFHALQGRNYERIGLAGLYTTIGSLVVFELLLLASLLGGDVGLVWQPAGRSARHDQAVRHYTKAKYEVGRLLDAGSGALDEESIKRVEELYLDDRDLPRVPEGKFLKLKRWHKLKVAVSKELYQDLSSVRCIKRRLEGGDSSPPSEEGPP
jgi:hypothetical protein